MSQREKRRTPPVPQALAAAEAGAAIVSIFTVSVFHSEKGNLDEQARDPAVTYAVSKLTLTLAEACTMADCPRDWDIEIDLVDNTLRLAHGGEAVRTFVTTAEEPQRMVEWLIAIHEYDGRR